MKKQKAILNLSRATANEVAVKASTIVSKMTANANFTTPAPTLSSITTQINLLNTKLTEQSTAFRTYQQKTVEVLTEKDNLLNLLDTEGTYVENAANGDEVKILSAGFDVKQKAIPIGLLPAPKDVLAEEGGSDGEVIVSWSPVRGAKSYVVEMSLDITSPDNWNYQATVTKSKCYLSALDSGTRIWVRVVAINAAGQGAYSDPATKTVP